MNSWRVALYLTLVAFSMPSQAQNRGLHNDTKKFTDPVDISLEDWNDPNEMERTWRAAIVRIPVGQGRSRRSSTTALEKKRDNGLTKLPTVIYLHGCGGVWVGTHRRVKFLADNGFLVIAPVSFARKKYARSCYHRIKKGALYWGALNIRQIDAGYAIQKARALPMVDGDNIVLMGLSQGGMTTATFEAKSDSQRVRARVVEGWTCNGGRGQMGINAPASEPVLTLVGNKDPWFQGIYTKGECTEFLDKNNGSKSVVYRKGVLAITHPLLNYRKPRNEVLRFLRAHIALPLTVREVQKVLKSQGFDPGPIDGAWGLKTLSALNLLRASHSLPPVGSLDSSSQHLLRSLRN